MHRFARAYRYVNLLSLDIVLGAMVSALFFGAVLQVEIRVYGLIALGLTVWIIYTADHLRDAHNIRKSAATPRHRFHQQYFKALLIAAAVAVLLNAINIIFIRKQVFVWGMVLAVGVSIYLFVQRYLKFLKEICIACLYTCGVLLPSITVTQVELTGAHYRLIVQFMLVALLNLLLFSWFDREGDEQDKQNSFVTMFGESTTRTCIIVLIAAGFALTLVSWYFQELTRAVNVVAAMGTVLTVIFVFRKTFATHDYFRLVGDAVFLLPLLYLA
ncbi:hypothetical protein [Chryseolinea lacunae]|uniref:Prenyltransferase n=1 Tax=Chryseolinea lacunae TaxID=2801331 RepID=A0ABS1KRU2_9BACT|nr:hypothetical protein [Chryseolinea lacunae]MBL0742164.1 hypothetical protein [Chryseolinea lacunae]